MGSACVAVAYSGGRDSTALLHATSRVAARHGLDVVALHVHHGLSRHADAWWQHCHRTCARWARAGHPVRLRAERIVGTPPPGASIEDWARARRYAALQRMALAEGAGLVLLAHHRRDQGETLLLQALRGAGVDGLSGMPECIGRRGLVWARPWLERPREEIEAYLRRHRLAYVEDDSNDDPRHARNRLRISVWPDLIAAFPQAEASLARAARWAQEASAALSELAWLDLQSLGQGSALRREAWMALSHPRRSNALRAWLRQCRGRPATAALIERLCAEWPAARHGRWPLEDGEVRSHDGLLAWHAAERVMPATADVGLPETVLQIQGAGLYRLPGWSGALQAAATDLGGVSLRVLGALDLLPRRGAERFQAGPGRPPRALKKQYQAAGVPPWLRSGPILYSAGRLVFVPGLGADARMLAQPGEEQLRLDWIANPTPRPG